MWGKLLACPGFVGLEQPETGRSFGRRESMIQSKLAACSTVAGRAKNSDEATLLHRYSSGCGRNSRAVRQGEAASCLTCVGLTTPWQHLHHRPNGRGHLNKSVFWNS